ncbi:MAG: TetR/AcrR family transcriptional regulator [Burkholderiaceae bacterium]|jgi:AcrR family transcriptional regulator|nr:TetR/AcrR family transcriptional regulator [Burkholderiaceae bacterium]
MTSDHRPAVAARRRERMRARLLHAALEVVAEKGSVAASIDDFVAHARVSRGTFYKYFPDVPSLVQAMAEAVSHELIAHLHPMVDTFEDPAQRIAVGMLAVLQMAQRLPPLGGLLTHLGWPRAEVSEMHTFFVLVGRDLDLGLRQRRFAKMDLRVALDLTAGLVIGAAHRLTTEPMPPDYAKQVTMACLCGLGLTRAQARAIVAIKFAVPDVSSDSVLGQLGQHARQRNPPAPSSGGAS